MTSRAALISTSGLFYARYDRAPGEPHSAITRLIQGVWRAHPKDALIILRERIFTDREPGAMDFGMLKVAAKRMRVLSPRQLDDWLVSQGGTPRIDLSVGAIGDPRIEAPARVSTNAPPPADADRFWLARARALALGVSRSSILYRSDRAVAALLVSREGLLIGQALNTNRSDRTLHAELNLVQRYFADEKKPLPVDAVLYSSLKPCRMCAGMIWDSAEDPARIRVVYDQDDPGPHARGTMLEALSADRRRFSPRSIWGSANLFQVQLDPID